MRVIPVAIVLSTLSLCACAHGPRPNPLLLRAPSAATPVQLAQAGDAGDVAVPPMPTTADAASPRLPSHALTNEILYKLVLGEVAAQRGNLRLAARAYLEVAQATKDPRIARRASELAVFGRVPELAIEASSLWLEAEPESTQARQNLVAALVGSNKVGEAKPYLEKLLAADPARTRDGFLQLYPLLARFPDKAGTLALVRELAQPYPKVAEAHVATAQAALAADQVKLAETELARALELEPALEPAAILKAQVLQRDSMAGAIEFLDGFTRRNPMARDARVVRARLLAAAGKPDAARAEFLALERELPNNAELVVTAGLLSLQMNDLDMAQAKLKRGLELRYRDADTLRFYLGQIAEAKQKPDEALDWYSKVEQGDQLVPAAARYAFILQRQNRLPEARAYLQGIDAPTPQQRIQLAQAEAQVLREARAYQDSFDVLGRTLEAQPDHPDLLYDYAMAAERLDRLDVLEAKLKRLIELKPDSAQAWNALGYSLADRSLRLPEARGFIQKALELAPDDAFILDSMGWVEYRMGNAQAGLPYIERAFTMRKDAEIAAHLGELLWAQGRKSDAEKVWRESATQHPDNEELRATMKRFLP